MAKHLTQSQIDLGVADAGDGDDGRPGGVKINANWAAAETAVNFLAGRNWKLDNAAATLAMGERIQCDTHAGITKTLPGTFAYDVDGLNDICVINHDDADDVTIAVASGDQIYRNGTGLGVDTSFVLGPGQLAILSIRTNSATWNLFVMSDDQAVYALSADLADYALLEYAKEYIGQNLQTGTAYTLVLTDAGKIVEMNNAAANDLTVPPNSSVAFPVDTRIDIHQQGAGLTTVDPGAGVTLRALGGGLKSQGQYAGLSLWKRATDEWVVYGGVV